MINFIFSHEIFKRNTRLLFHLIVNHQDSMLFNEGISIDEDVTIDNLFTPIASDTFDPELWNEEFEAYFGNTKFGNKVFNKI